MTNPTVAETIERAQYLLSLDSKSNGGPYKGYAAQVFLEALRNSVSHLERLQAENDQLREAAEAVIDEYNAEGGYDLLYLRDLIDDLRRAALAQEEGR